MSKSRIMMFWRMACCRPIVVNSIKISLVVGTILNIVNQGHYLMAGEDIMVSHLILNYIVPYLVSTTSAVMTHLKQAEMQDFERQQTSD